LIETRKHFQKNILGKILLWHAARKVRPDDADDHGIQVLDQLARSVLIAAAHTSEAANQIKRLVVRHD
jgi:hypothetical protein